MAEGILKHLLATAYARTSLAKTEVISAGMQAEPDNPALRESVEAAAKFGVDISQHRSRPLTKELLDAADYVLVMEASHLRSLRFISPTASMKTALLKSFIEKNPKKQDISDPVGRPLRYHVECFEELMRAIQGFLKHIHR